MLHEVCCFCMLEHPVTVFSSRGNPLNVVFPKIQKSEYCLYSYFRRCFTQLTYNYCLFGSFVTWQAQLQTTKNTNRHTYIHTYTDKHMKVAPACHLVLDFNLLSYIIQDVHIFIVC